MMSDIDRPEVEDIAMAIVPELNDADQTDWQCYLINMKPREIEAVLVSSRGYGEKEDEKIKTSQLRHFLGEMAPNSFQKVELIPEDLLGLTNQYWVSFYMDGKMYDKKYLFVPESIQEENLTPVPVIGKKGVLII